jgi:hypothetical protein
VKEKVPQVMSLLLQAFPRNAALASRESPKDLEDKGTSRQEHRGKERGDVKGGNARRIVELAHCYHVRFFVVRRTNTYVRESSTNRPQASEGLSQNGYVHPLMDRNQNTHQTQPLIYPESSRWSRLAAG